MTSGLLDRVPSRDVGDVLGGGFSAEDCVSCTRSLTVKVLACVSSSKALACGSVIGVLAWVSSVSATIWVSSARTLASSSSMDM
jgi:hypothetical protein